MKANKEYSELLALFCEGKTDKNQTIDVIRQLLSNDKKLYQYEVLSQSLDDEQKDEEGNGDRTKFFDAIGGNSRYGLPIAAFSDVSEVPDSDLQNDASEEIIDKIIDELYDSFDNTSDNLSDKDN